MAGVAYKGQWLSIALAAIVFLAVAVGSSFALGHRIAPYLRQDGSSPEPDRVIDGAAAPEPLRLSDVRDEPAPVPRAAPGLAPDEESLRRVRKLEAVERLRDGIVHDLNNKLMVISANIDSVARQMKERPALQRKLLSALVASDQAGSLIARSTAFARQHRGRIRPIDLAERIDSVAALMGRSLLRDTVELHVDIAEDLWPVRVDQDDLETAIVTLSAYVRDALTQGGTITLEARNVQVEKGSLSNLTLGGEFVQLVIGGSGGGDRARGQELLEERAFSLRDVDLSPWLTLSRSLQFLDPLGGTAEVRNTGKGTSIALYLPRADAPAWTASDFEEDEFAERAPAPRDTEILVVDDEVEVALAVQSMLEEFGYIARIATGAGQAMKSLQTRKPDLVLADVSMPGTMNGVMLAREIRQIYPGLPVLLITGNPVVSNDVAEYPLLHKPIVSRDLHAAILQHLSPEEENKVVPLFPRSPRRIS